MNSSQSIHFVTGESGTGKSVTCYLVLKDYLAKGGVGFGIPGDIAARANSLEEAIDLTLRSLCPTIEPDAGSTALRLQNSRKRLLLIVDDVNRCGNPAVCLEKLIRYAQPPRDESPDALFAMSYLIIVPVWDNNWAPLDYQSKLTSWIERIPIKKMDESEALRCLDASLGPRAQEFAEPDRQQIVAALGNDPFLIARYGASDAKPNQYTHLTLANDVMVNSIDSAEAEAALSGGYLKADYDCALMQIADRMLRQRNHYPLWVEVRDWLSRDELQAITELTKTEKVCRVNDRGGEYYFEFRHDRILEHFLVRALRVNILPPGRR